MSMTRFLTLLALSVLVVSALGTGTSVDAAFPHGTPAYDSGWRDITTNLYLSHGLGGDVDDYVVDLQHRDLGSESNIGVHHLAFGGDASETAAGAQLFKGITVASLTSSILWLYRSADDSTGGQVRARIWLVTTADYDSGWHSMTASSPLTLVHNLGGDVGDYVVDLWTIGGDFDLRSQAGYGGDSFYDGSLQHTGIYWSELDASQVKLLLQPDNTWIEQYRLRIFRLSDPAYDSGWNSLFQASLLNLEHGLGGPWNDFVVDVQFKSTGALGINHYAYGGNTYSNPPGTNTHLGAYWHNLTGGMISVWRFADDISAEQVRVRIWEDRAPKYDSWWTPLPANASTAFAHGLAGDSEWSVVDMQLLEDFGLGFINNRNYGIDSYFDSSGGGSLNSDGAAWFSLTGAGVFVERGGTDDMAGLGRIRIWQAPHPDFDSGWQAISAGVSLPLNHGLSGTASNYVVDLQFRSVSFGVNQLSYGTDQYWDASASTYRYKGCDWYDLDSSSVKVFRNTDDDRAEEVRLRIWKNSSFDWVTAWTTMLQGSWNWYHNLGISRHDLVVDLQMESDHTGYDRHHHRFGGDRYDSGGSVLGEGVYWDNLNESLIGVTRYDEDVHADRVRVRLWNTEVPTSALTISIDGSGSGRIISTPSGIDCGDDCSEPFNHGIQVVLTPWLDPYTFVFAGWSGDPDCADGTVVMTTDVSCTATFDLSPNAIFADGFESGNTSAWSQTLP